MKMPTPPMPSAPSAVIDESLLDGLSARDYEALQWTVRADNGLSPDQQAQLDAWLAADEENRQAYLGFAAVSQAFEGMAPEHRALLQTSRATAPHASGFAAPLNAAAKTERACDTTRVRRRRHRFTAFAMVALGVLGSMGWWDWEQVQQASAFGQDYATRQGQNLTVKLPDGSRLFLDTATLASVAFYPDRREVRLPEGQVQFQVQADSSRPFHVLAGASRITVVGTQFSVRYTPSTGDPRVQVAVQQGQVHVSGSLQPQTVELHGGQAVAADAQGRPGPVVPTPLAVMGAWQQQRLNFDNVPLGQVLAELRRYGHSDWVVQDNQLAGLPLTASIDLHRLDAFRVLLQEVLPVRVVQRDETVEIVRR